MDLAVFLAVLAAAFLHAGWNALLKLGVDRFSSVLLLALVQGLVALPILPFVTQPDPAGWGWIAAGAALHAGYKIFLIYAYEHGDLGQVYPLARGTAPLIVTVVSLAFLGAEIGGTGLAAILTISGGVLLMAFRGGATPGAMPPRALAFALGTAGFTAAYTMADGIGARVAGTASGFILWMVLGDAVLMLGWGLWLRGRAAVAGLRPAWRTGFAAGVMSLGSYWIAVWGFTQAPIALVAALRESSILFAVLIATFVLGEPTTLWRWGATGLIAGGVVLMRL